MVWLAGITDITCKFKKCGERSAGQMGVEFTVRRRESEIGRAVNWSLSTTISLDCKKE